MPPREVTVLRARVGNFSGSHDERSPSLISIQEGCHVPIQGTHALRLVKIAYVHAHMHGRTTQTIAMVTKGRDFVETKGVNAAVVRLKKLPFEK